MNPIKPTIKTEILPILLVLSAILSSFYFYANFPEQVPTHWNIYGEVDHYGSKLMGAFLFPVIMIGVYLLFLFLPFLDPKKERYGEFKKIYHFFKFYILFFLVSIYFVTGFNSVGYNISVGLWIPALVGLLFVIIGNYMGKIKPNWFMGIRTPWTLSSEEVWNKTHRFGGKIFIVSGFLMAMMNFYPINFRLPIFIITIIAMVFGTFLYSYILYIKEKKDGKRNN